MLPGHAGNSYQPLRATMPATAYCPQVIDSVNKSFYCRQLESFGTSKRTAHPITSARILIGWWVWCFTGSGSVQSQQGLWHQNVTGCCSSEQGNEPNAADLLSCQKSGWVAVAWVRLHRMTHTAVLFIFFDFATVFGSQVPLGCSALVCFWHLKRWLSSGFGCACDQHVFQGSVKKPTTVKNQKTKPEEHQQQEKEAYPGD